MSGAVNEGERTRTRAAAARGAETETRIGTGTGIETGIETGTRAEIEIDQTEIAIGIGIASLRSLHILPPATIRTAHAAEIVDCMLELWLGPALLIANCFIRAVNALRMIQ